MFTRSRKSLIQYPLRRRVTRVFFAWPVLAAALSGCGGGGGGAPSDVLQQTRTPTDQLVLKSANSCSDWRTFAARSFVEQALSPVFAFAEDVPVSAPAGEDGAGFSDTNTQEAGVDEADLIESDTARGLFYAVHRPSNSVRVIDALPANEAREIARIDLLGTAPIGLFFEPETLRLVAISRDADGTRADFYSMAAPESATLLNTYRTDGFYLGARRIDSRVHLVSSHFFRGLDGLYQNQTFNDRVNAWFEAQGESNTARADSMKAELIAQATAFAQSTEIADLVPNRAAGIDAALSPLACDALFRPDVATAMATVMVSSVNTDGSNPAAVAAANNAWELYASANNIYLAQTSGGWFFAPFQAEQTVIYRFETSATTAPRYRGAGVVDGWLLNRFSMGEHAGHLRIATSRTGDQCRSTDPTIACPAVEPTPTNDVAVLRLDADAMPQVGRVTGFGNNERIFSARFLGDVGYVVTFEQIDPLFTFDLSDPASPTLLGEVEIPGFSSCIQPIAAGRLLTIGRAAGPDGVGTGNAFQLQIFDVSDLTNPARIAAATPALEGNDYAYSVAEYDALAFTYAADSATTGLLSVPTQIGSRQQSRSLSGFTAWSIDTAGAISERFRVDHKQTDSNQSERCPPAANGSTADCESFAPVVYNQPLRSVIATATSGQTLYTMSDAFLIVSRASDGAELARVAFSEP